MQRSPWLPGCPGGGVCTKVQGDPLVMALVIKKYGNRRLYDADASRYVTLGEIAAKIRKGA